MENPLISVVVPAYNGAEDLKACLMSIDDSMSISGEDSVEVLVVDDGSTEPIGEMVMNFFPQFRVMRTENNGPAAARNTGIRNSYGEVIAFTDSDCMVDEKWIPMIADFAMGDYESVGMQGAPWHYDAHGNGAAHYDTSLQKILFCSHVRNKKCLTMDTRNVALRRDKINELYPDGKVFPEHLKEASAEDRIAGENIVAAGGVIKWNPSLTVYHKAPEGLIEIMKQKMRHGRGSFYQNGKDMSFIQRLDKQLIAPTLLCIGHVPVSQSFLSQAAYLIGHYVERYSQRKASPTT